MYMVAKSMSTGRQQIFTIRYNITQETVFNLPSHHRLTTHNSLTFNFSLNHTHTHMSLVLDSTLIQFAAKLRYINKTKVILSLSLNHTVPLVGSMVDYYTQTNRKKIFCLTLVLLLFDCAYAFTVAQMRTTSTISFKAESGD